MKRISLIAFWCALLAGVAQAGLVERWVDASAAAGGDGSKAKPYQQITSATGTSWGVNPLVVHIAGGTYERVNNIPNGGTGTSTFLGEGTADNPVIIDGQHAGPCIGCPTWSEFQRPLVVSNIVFKNGCDKNISGNLTLYGAGIRWRKVESVVDCTFTDCFATNAAGTACGGGLGSAVGPVAITNCTFRNCTASASGGAVWIGQEYRTTFTGCTFDGCRAKNGGAVYVQRYLTSGYSEETICGCNIDDCTFTNNTATASCSAIYGIVNRCADSRFYDNHADTDAKSCGGIWGMAEKLTNDKSYLQTNTFTRCVFRANTGSHCALFYGHEEASGIKFKRLLVEDCTIEDNVSSSGPCLVCGDVQHCFVTNCTVRRNAGPSLFKPNGFTGGAAVLAQPDFNVKILDTVFSENDGGSGDVVYIARARMLVDRCRFLTNECANVINIQGIDSTPYTNAIYNCLFDANVATSGVIQAFWCQAEGIRLCNNTFVNNRAAPTDSWQGIVTGFGNALEFEDKGILLANNIVYANRRIGGAVADQCGSRWTSYCNNNWIEDDGYAPVANGVRANVVGTDPKFLVRGGIDCLPGRPCRNKAATYDWMTGATDLRGKGHPRIVDGKPDIGCYECGMEGFIMVFRKK